MCLSLLWDPPGYNHTQSLLFKAKAFHQFLSSENNGEQIGSEVITQQCFDVSKPNLVQGLKTLF